MKNLIPVILPFLLLSLTQFAMEKRDNLEASFRWSDFDSQSQKAEYILKKIKKWQKQDHVDGSKKLRVVYFHPKDRKPLNNHLERWDRIMNDIQNRALSKLQRQSLYLKHFFLLGLKRLLTKISSEI